MASTTSVRILGIQEAQRLLGDMGGAIRLLAGVRVRAMSRLPYAYGIRTGHHRGGTLARRAGGTRAVDHARDQVVPGLVPKVAAALLRGGSAAADVIYAGAQEIVDITSQTEAIKSGDLRRSYHVERG